MKPTAIVYTSKTGHTRRYAELLGREMGLPVYALRDACVSLAPGSPILYLGWLCASRIRGYRRARGRFRVLALCGVGIGQNGSQLGEVKKSNILPDGLPLFILRGGFNKAKLHGPSRLVIIILTQQLMDKKNRTPQEQEMLSTLTGDLDYVSTDNLKDVLAWVNTCLLDGKAIK